MSLRVIIVEDEPANRRQLEHLLKNADKDTELLASFESVADTVAWLKQHKEVDLAIMDIRLTDGLSFEIFDQVDVTIPVIFATAYDDHAMDAFKANGIAYILKPYDQSDLDNAMKKLDWLSNKQQAPMQDVVKQLYQQMEQRASYKRSFLVQFRDKLIPLNVEQIAWIYTENEIVYVRTHKNDQYVLSNTLEQLEGMLDPEMFFRANRQYLVNRSAIKEMEVYFNGRLVLHVSPESKTQVIVSKAKAPDLKRWMDL